MDTNARSHYPTDLSDSQWYLIEGLIPSPKSGPGLRGRPAYERRALVEAMLYMTKSGCQWRLLPREFGRWQSVYRYFNDWSRSGLWARLLEHLGVRERVRQGHHPRPSAGCVDSQSVKAANQPVTAISFDGHKRNKGRKRHVLTDTLGIILCVLVTAAGINDRTALKALLKRRLAQGHGRRLRKLWVDAGYSGQGLRDWVRGLKPTHKIDLEVTDHQGQGFQVVPKRWVAERAFSWLLAYRRHSKDYEVLSRNSEAMIQLSMIHILIRRLA